MAAALTTAAPHGALRHLPQSHSPLPQVCTRPTRWRRILLGNAAHCSATRTRISRKTNPDTGHSCVRWTVAAVSGEPSRYPCLAVACGAKWASSARASIPKCCHWENEKAGRRTASESRAVAFRNPCCASTFLWGGKNEKAGRPGRSHWLGCPRRCGCALSHAVLRDGQFVIARTTPCGVDGFYVISATRQ